MRDVFFRIIAIFRWNDVRAQQRGNHGAVPLLRGESNGLERLHLVFEAEAVTGLGFDGRGALRGHFVESIKNVLRRGCSSRLAHAAKAGANAASGVGDFFVVGSGDALFEVDQARSGEDRMGVGVDEAGKDHFAASNRFRQRFRASSCFATSSVVPTATIFAVSDEHGAVFDDAQFAHLRAATRRCRRAAQGEQLRGVSQKRG